VDCGGGGENFHHPLWATLTKETEFSGPLVPFHRREGEKYGSVIQGKGDPRKEVRKKTVSGTPAHRGQY